MKTWNMMEEAKKTEVCNFQVEQSKAKENMITRPLKQMDICSDSKPLSTGKPFEVEER